MRCNSLIRTLYAQPKPGMRQRMYRMFTQLMFLALAGCLSPIDRSSDLVGGQVVISGQISPLVETNIVYVGRTSSEERLPEPISGALVQLTGDDGSQVSYVEDQVPGKYILPDFPGTPGVTFSLRVSLPDGETYESVPEKMPTAIGEDQIYYRIESEEYTDEDGIVAERNFLNIYSSYVASPDNTTFVKWHAEEVYVLSPTDFPDPFGSVPPPCYIAQQVDPQRIVLFNSEEVNTSTIPELLISSRIVDRTFKERHYFTTFQSSLTQQAYDYWTNVEVVANNTGSIFDPPPARVKGNIFNSNDGAEEVHGYFQAVNQTYSRFYVLPKDLPFDIPLHCEYRPDREFYTYPSECLNCLSVRNSSYNRPPWF